MKPISPPTPFFKCGNCGFEMDRFSYEEHEGCSRCQFMQKVADELNEMHGVDIKISDADSEIFIGIIERAAEISHAEF